MRWYEIQNHCVAFSVSGDRHVRSCRPPRSVEARAFRARLIYPPEMKRYLRRGPEVVVGSDFETTTLRNAVRSSCRHELNREACRFSLTEAQRCIGYATIDAIPCILKPVSRRRRENGKCCERESSPQQACHILRRPAS